LNVPLQANLGVVIETVRVHPHRSIRIPRELLKLFLDSLDGDNPAIIRVRKHVFDAEALFVRLAY
jgi:hypothetical protein